MADSYHHTRDAVDDLVDTLTGRIRLTPVTPDAAAQPAQTQPFRQAPQAQPAHTGFTRIWQLRGPCRTGPHRLYPKPGPGSRRACHRLLCG